MAYRGMCTKNRWHKSITKGALLSRTPVPKHFPLQTSQIEICCVLGTKTYKKNIMNHHLHHRLLKDREDSSLSGVFILSDVVYLFLLELYSSFIFIHSRVPKPWTLCVSTGALSVVCENCVRLLIVFILPWCRFLGQVILAEWPEFLPS